jgi:hypothetical protein
MGDKLPLTFQEIDSYCKTTKRDLSRWEVLTIRDLSSDYVYQLGKKEISEMPPYLETDEFTYLNSLK